jgi:hypothetical protein
VTLRAALPAGAAFASLLLAGCGAPAARASADAEAPSTAITGPAVTGPAATVPVTADVPAGGGGTTVPTTGKTPATSTPGAPATTAPVVTAMAAAPSPTRALEALVATFGPAHAVSPFAGQGHRQLVAVDREAPAAAGGSQVIVGVYAWDGTALQSQASVPLGQDGTTGLLLPASEGETPITVVELTGSAEPDFAVTTASAGADIITIVSDQTGTWRAVPFDTPSGPALGVPSAVISGRTVRATFDSCTPTCAQGGAQTVTFAYQGGSFVAQG